MRALTALFSAAVLLALVLLSPGARAVEAQVPHQAIPYKRETSSAESDLVRLVGALAVCGAVLGGVLYVLRRRPNLLGGNIPTRRKKLELLETQRLGPRATLYVVRFAGSLHVLAHSEHGITRVASAAEPPEATEASE
jgi:flagellar biogenesis protein FliO